MSSKRSLAGRRSPSRSTPRPARARPRSHRRKRAGKGAHRHDRASRSPHPRTSSATSGHRAALRYAWQNQDAPDRQRALRESGGPATEPLPHRYRRAPRSTRHDRRSRTATTLPSSSAGLSAEKSRRRVNFVFDSGDELRLLTGNDAANVPQYDLALVAAKVLSSPAEPAALGPSRAIVVLKKSPPRLGFGSSSLPPR